MSERKHWWERFFDPTDPTDAWYKTQEGTLDERRNMAEKLLRQSHVKEFQGKHDEAAAIREGVRAGTSG